MSSYDYDLTNKIPKALDREQNERLHARVMEADDKAREEMIESNMPLVISKVDSFIQQNPRLVYLRDDLHSAGFVGLVLAVNKMAEGSDISNPTGYISVAITHEFVKLAKKEAVHIGIDLVDLPTIDMDLGSDVLEVSHDIPESIVDTNQAATQDALELRDLLESCCESDKERTLLRMREEGCSDREIAEALDTSRTSIQALRKELEERFNRKCRELEE